MTAGNPEKSVPSFLVPLLVQFWTRSGTTDTAQSQLARQQFEFYANQILRRDPYAIHPEAAAVAHARTYLSNLGAKPRIYQDMQTAADKTNAGIDFNRQYPNAAGFIVEPHFIRGSFTSSGFKFMQDAIQHPERYFQGETWVLGQQGGVSVDTTGVSKKLADTYAADYVKEWHAFLADAKLGNCGALQQAPERLTTLAGSESPILEFLYVVSANTAVADPRIKDVFQPAQLLVAANATNRLIGPGNTNYVNALLALSGVATQFNQSPDTSKDLLNPAVSAARLVVQQTAQGFNVDSQGHTDKIVMAILESPMQCIVPPPPPPPPGPPGGLCTMLAKYPFISLSKTQASKDLTNNEQATLEEVNATFAPGTGSISAYYTQNLKQWMTLKGTQYVLEPGAEGHVGPAFLAFFNKLARISSSLYPPGSPVAAFNFTLRAVPSKGIEKATLVVDGQRIADGATAQQFKWNAAVAHQASVAYNTSAGLQFQGTWALFQLVSMAHVTRMQDALDLEFPVEVSGRPSTLPDGTPVVIRFELSGPGADVLAPGALPGLPCVTSVVK